MYFAEPEAVILLSNRYDGNALRAMQSFFWLFDGDEFIGFKRVNWQARPNAVLCTCQVIPRNRLQDTEPQMDLRRK